MAGTVTETQLSDVPMEFSAELFFANGVSATFYNSFLTENQQWANVAGTVASEALQWLVVDDYGSVRKPKFRQV